MSKPLYFEWQGVKPLLKEGSKMYIEKKIVKKYQRHIEIKCPKCGEIIFIKIELRDG